METHIEPGGDIDERERAEDALRRSEAVLREAERDLRLTIDTIPVFVAVYRPDGTRSFVNRTWQEHMGLTLEEATGPSAKTFPHFHPADAERNDRAWRAALASGEPLTIEVRVRRADGQYRWHTSRRVPLRDASGNILRWYSIGIDIEDQKIAEDALRRSEARLAEAERDLQLTIDTIPTLVATYRPDGSRIFVNRTWLDYTGLSLDSAINAERTSIVHPDDAARVDQDWQKSLSAGVPFQAEMRLRRADGEYRWHAVERVLRRDESGAIVKWYSVGVDIEEQKRAEEAVRQSEARLAETERELRLMVDTIPVLVARHCADGRREYGNKQLRDYLGPDVPIENTAAIIHPDDLARVNETWRAHVASGEPSETEQRMRRADGEYRWHLVRRAPLRDENGDVIKWYAVGIDIEDQKFAKDALGRSDARLAEAERELRLTLDSIPTITWRAAPNGYVQHLNKRWFDYTGTTPEEVRGWRWKSCVHPDDLDQLVDIGREYVATETPIDGEARLRRFDGEYRWFLFRPAPARDETGKLIGWYGTITDIEDRKRAEQALQKSEADLIEAKRALQQTIDTIPTTVARYSTDGKREFVNAAWKEFTGLSDQAALGTQWLSTAHPDDVEAGERKWREARATGQPLHIEARFRRADGEYRWLAVSRVPLRDEAGNVSKWYSVSYDIEDRKRAEEAAAASERNLKLIIDTIPVLAWSARLDGSAEFVNQHFIDYVGLSLDQLRDWGWKAAVHPDDLDELGSAWQAIRASGRAGEAEARLRRHDGEYRWFLFRASPLRDENGNIVKWYGVNTDIEDRKRAEERIRNTQSELAHMTRAMTMGTLTASIAHEVNQPLAGIITNAGTCLRMLAADPPNIEGARETARRTIRDGNRAADVITRLRALFSRKAPVSETVDLNEATREVLALAFSDLLRNRVALRVELDDEPLLVVGDRVQLQQVILNLVRNASDAMSEVNNRQRSLLVKAGREEGGRARLSVRDTGVGFEPQVVGRLFDAFFTTKGDGMGIGLSVSRSIIESHGGKLWAEQNDGPGATFSFSIPRQSDGAIDAGAVGVGKVTGRGDHDVMRNA